MFINYIASIFLGWMVFFHPFYISVTDINYNADNHSLEIAQKIFWDDLEVALSNVHGERVDFMNPEDPTLLTQLIKEYLLKHNEITINGKKAELKYLGFEIEEDAAWFYLEAKEVKRPESALIQNTVLISDYPDQRNMVNFYLDKKPKTLILYEDHEKGSLHFK